MTLEAVTDTVGCLGGQHRIEWAEGTLRLLDHDVEAERALAALGSEPPTCVKVIDAWSGFEVDPYDPRMLVALIAGDALSERARTQLETKYGARAGDTRFFQLAWSLGSRTKVQKMLDQAKHFLVLYELPVSLRQRFAYDYLTNAEKKWRTKGFKRKHFAALELLLNLVAERAFRQTVLGVGKSIGIGVAVPMKWGVLDPGAPPHFSGLISRSTVRYETRLSISWLSRVWVRGLAVVDETFVLDVEKEEGERLKVLAIRWIPESPESYKARKAPAWLEPKTSGWSLSWIGA
ncbi:MAG: hypothetical protein KY429_05140 [Actinobacteria bacterium]|nr:hypothetical protein [Actinomycetota bacterium]